MKSAKFFSTVSAALVSILFSANIAHAIVLTPGTFVPVQCGAQEKADVSIASVCVGQIAGEKGRAVQFKFNDESVRTFKVINQTNLLIGMNSGNRKSNLFLQSPEGEMTTMKTIMSSEGQVLAVSGQLGTSEYLVQELEIVYVIQ